MEYNEVMAGLQDDNRESFDEALARANEAERKKKEREKSTSVPSLPLLAELEAMDRKALFSLLEKVLAAGWGYGKLTGKQLLETALMSKDNAYEALKLTALTLAHNASDWREFHALATFWSERERGKPVGAAPQINIGTSGNMEVKVILVSADKKEEVKMIEAPMIKQ